MTGSRIFDFFYGVVGRMVAWLGSQWPWFLRKSNAIAINFAVNVCRHRPHPWSTVHDYTSWTSLTDQHWSARHLPPKEQRKLPDAATIVNLFRRSTPGVQRLSDKSTCLFPAFAQYLTDGFLRTRMPNTSIGEGDEVRLQNTSNQQIDLCTLYGRLAKQTDALRLKSESKGERGRLKSQLIKGGEFAPFLFDLAGNVRTEFAELDEPLGLDKTPQELRQKLFAFGGNRTNGVPQVAMLNTLFLREHNRLAQEIEAQHGEWDDERVFETTRNTLIALFIKLVVEEYINHISPSFRFVADPSVAWTAAWNRPNWVTTEFSLLYRWHSLVPDTIRWAGRVYPVMETLMNNEPLLVGGLAQAFIDMSSQPAGVLGAFNTADGLLPIEVRGVEQGRLCRLASYSDYRAYVGLSRPSGFEAISSNDLVTSFLKDAYSGVVEDVEFYVGIFAEDLVQDSPLPPLILRMVAVDAFSQALTNPLLSETVYHSQTFSEQGWSTINRTGSLRDLLLRNTSREIGDEPISMTAPTWRWSW